MRVSTLTATTLLLGGVACMAYPARNVLDAPYCELTRAHQQSIRGGASSCAVLGDTEECEPDSAEACDGDCSGTGQDSQCDQTIWTEQNDSGANSCSMEPEAGSEECSEPVEITCNTYYTCLSSCTPNEVGQYVCDGTDNSVPSEDSDPLTDSTPQGEECLDPTIIGMKLNRWRAIASVNGLNFQAL